LKHDTAIDLLVQGCLRNDRRSQGQLYARFRSFAMGICLRYAADRDDAAENMNRGFQNVFLNLKKSRTERQFKAWLGRIMINISIDDLRRRSRQNRIIGIEETEFPGHSDTLPSLDYKDILAMVQRLPQVLRKVFVLWAIEGYTHKEISVILGKSEGTCKYHLFAARRLLRKMILRKPCQL
jgi:RNA polymerase sigma factor (sigma-70 family)